MPGEGPVGRRQHQTDNLATKAVGKADDLQQKTFQTTGKDTKDDSKQPAGGYDAIGLPRVAPGYTVRFTFHKAANLPAADINTMSSDPYVVAELQTDIKPRHKQDPPLTWRTRTIRRNLNPEWNTDWIVANVPASGFKMKCRVYDEDPADHDDRLGNVHIEIPGISESWQGLRNEVYKIKKKSGSKRAYFLRGCAAIFSRNVHMSGELHVSAEVLGHTHDDNGGRLYTLGPCDWTQHFSPTIGRLVGTKDPGKNEKGGKQVERYDFQANQIQCRGPVPEHMYHRYVEFRPFVQGMFTSKSLRGRILNRALHHQHSRIYNFDRATVYGSFPNPCEDMTRKFLDLVHYDAGGRIYTYVLLLDGLWRFTETGKEFGIDLLSKHTMHSNVSMYIAFSGEFFIRRLKNPHKGSQEQKTHLQDEISDGLRNSEPPKDPAYYQLIIDNDSGTYRPNKDLLPQLKLFMEKSLPGLKITTLDCTNDKEKTDKWKGEQRERKKSGGDKVALVQPEDDDSDTSSSDDETPDSALAYDSTAGPSQSRNQLHYKERKMKKTNNGAVDDAKKMHGLRYGEHEWERKEGKDVAMQSLDPIGP